MTSPKTHTLFAILRHGDINGRLAAQDGQLLLIVDNYTQLYPELPPVPADSNTHIYAVTADDEDLAIEMDNGVQVWRVWKGDKTSRQRPQEKAMLPIRSLKGAPTAATFGDPSTAPADVARAAFAELPESVRLAAVLASVSCQALIDLPDIGPAITQRLKTWADKVLNDHVARGTDA